MKNGLKTTKTKQLKDVGDEKELSFLLEVMRNHLPKTDIRKNGL